MRAAELTFQDLTIMPLAAHTFAAARWERPSAKRLRVQMTLTDPRYYTKPWTSSYKGGPAGPLTEIEKIY